VDYESSVDYRNVAVTPDRDSPMLTLRDAARVLQVTSEQVRRLVLAGRLPAWRGAAGQSPYLVPLWAVEGLAAARTVVRPSDSAAQLQQIADRLGRVEAAVLGDATHGVPDEEVGRLRGEVESLRSANATLRDSEGRLAVAAGLEHEAANALARAADLAQQALAAYVEAERARASAAEAYAASSLAYRMPGHPGDDR
jgi:hypothetical protein